MGRKRRIKAANKRQTVDFTTLMSNLDEEDELQELLGDDIPPNYSRCNPNHDHARACAPDEDPERCACGCTYDGSQWCISAEEFMDAFGAYVEAKGYSISVVAGNHDRADIRKL
jgi:hypothetical protein